MNMLEQMMMVEQKDPTIPYASKELAEEALQEFINHKPKFEVNDKVVRNKFGLVEYQFPKEDQHQLAIVVQVVDSPVREDGDLNDILIAVAIGQGVFKQFFASSKYYEKANTSENIIGIGQRKK